jgi:thioredoxin-dependent peroxiredoxin
VAKGLVILGASTDGLEANARFAKKYAFPFPLLCDADRTLCLAYHAVEAKDGIAKRISYLVGADGRIEAAWPKVKPAGHPAEVMAALG